MKTMILAVAVLVSGCGVHGEYNTLCDTRIVWKAGGEDSRLNCGRLWHNLGLAKRYMMQEFTLRDGTKFTPIRSEEEWKHYFGEVNVWVSSEDVIPDPNDPSGTGDLWGYYDGLSNTISLEVDERSLVHEMFHRIDYLNLRPGTMLHEGWDTNGYAQVIDFYNVSYQLPVGQKR